MDVLPICRQLILEGKDAESAYWELVIKDIQDACKLFEPIYDATDGGDGYVSVEVSPRLAHETTETVNAAKWLHKLVDRPNVYIKIPATAECVPSIKEVISLGISVNVTVSLSLIQDIWHFCDVLMILSHSHVMVLVSLCSLKNFLNLFIQSA